VVITVPGTCNKIFMVLRKYRIGPTKYSSLLVQRQYFERKAKVRFFFLSGYSSTICHCGTVYHVEVEMVLKLGN
jgi:hypothetical protein